MLDTSLAEKPVDEKQFTELVEVPAVYYGAAIKHEFDNQRLSIKNGVKIKHRVTTLIDKKPTKTINLNGFLECFTKPNIAIS